MKKVRVLMICIETNEKKIKDLKTSLENTRIGARDAPGSNVSHSDTSKFQQSNLALGIEGRLIDATKTLNMLKILPTNICDTITIGSFFVLEEYSSGKTVYYLLVPQGGGDQFNVDDKIILSISGRTPLAMTVIGKKTGDKIKFKGKSFKVLDVQ